MYHGTFKILVYPLTVSVFPPLCFSIEFDRDCDYFAIAGVTKKIKVFEYGTVIQDAVDIHYPVNEMTCNSKIRYRTHSGVTSFRTYVTVPQCSGCSVSDHILKSVKRCLDTMILF